MSKRLVNPDDKKQDASSKLSASIKVTIIVILLILSIFWLFFPLLFVAKRLMDDWTTWSKRKKFFIAVPFELYYSVVFILAVGVLIELFFFKPVQVNGDAMSPKYNNGMYLLERVLPKSVEYNRGDVITFIPPTSMPPDNKNTDFMKRVIGLPGETVSLKSDGVYINDSKLDESGYLPVGVQTEGSLFFLIGKSFIIPADQYFVLGDNRSHSYDSRTFGFVPKSVIVGKIAFCFWNCSK